jgi:hypothetical protein
VSNRAAVAGSLCGAATSRSAIGSCRGRLRPPGFQLSLILGADSLHSEAISDTILSLTLRGPGTAGSILSNEWELEL